MFKTILTH